MAEQSIFLGRQCCFQSLSWAEALLGQRGKVDKALVYNTMKIRGLPSPPADNTISNTIMYQSNCTLRHYILGLGIFFLIASYIDYISSIPSPSFLLCRNLPFCFLFALQFTQIALWSGWHIPPSPLLISMLIARFLGPQARWHAAIASQPLPPDLKADRSCVQGS